jgi:hypothetical protein
VRAEVCWVMGRGVSRRSLWDRCGAAAFIGGPARTGGIPPVGRFEPCDSASAWGQKARRSAGFTPIVHSFARPLHHTKEGGSRPTNFDLKGARVRVGDRKMTRGIISAGQTILLTASIARRGSPVGAEDADPSTGGRTRAARGLSPSAGRGRPIALHGRCAVCSPRAADASSVRRSTFRAPGRPPTIGTAPSFESFAHEPIRARAFGAGTGRADAPHSGASRSVVHTVRPAVPMVVFRSVPSLLIRFD